jgi:uncharacterized protein
MNIPPIQHTHDAFVIEDGERMAELTYTTGQDGVVSLDHTWVREDLREHKLGRKLIDAAADWARKEGKKLTPVCSYARAVFDRDKSLADVRA